MNIIDTDIVIQREHLPKSILDSFFLGNEVLAFSHKSLDFVDTIKNTDKTVESSGDKEINLINPTNVDTPPADDFSLKNATDSLEKKLILDALERSKGNVSQAALFLDMKRPTLQYKMKRYGITKDSLHVTYKFD